jgi:transketolase
MERGMPEEIRVAYGKALVELGARNPNIVVLDADMASGTQTYMFRRAYPDRFFDLGIAEQNMMDVAAGLTLGGKIPFVNTFAYLLVLRAGEMLRTMVCYGRMNVKVAGGYGGLSGTMDGPTHHAITDLAVVRSLPNIVVMVASDDVSARAGTFAAAEHVGPVYWRLCRNAVPTIHDRDFAFVIGRGVELKDGRDVTLIGTGVMVGRCLEAAKELSRDGISARVIEIHTLKPLDREIIIKAARETGAIVTAEEHVINGGLGSAVAEVLVENIPVPMERIGLNDTFAETGPWLEVMDRYGLSVAHIVAAARKVLRRRG